ncbi:MAG: lamin tail domain-containing protein, partial [Bacteroidetes bacterium]|nr:lamin tail domain-containing protein [Bacteroidota bacterium]
SGEHILVSPVSDNTLLLAGDSPYITLGDIIVDSNVTLSAEPGVEIRMADSACFIVYGNLDFKGAEDLPVVIRPNENAGFSCWGAICISNATDTTFLCHVQLPGSSNGRHLPEYKGAVSAYSSNVILDNVTIEDAEQPFFSQYGDRIEIRNSTFRSQRTCDLINIKYAGYALVEECDLKGNNSYDTDGIDYDQIDGGIIRNNTIYGFNGYNSDGIDIGENAQNILIENNRIANCTDKGISIGRASSAIVRRNLIMECNMGVGIKDSLAFALIDQNTFYNNGYAVACFEKNQGDGGGHATVVNSILSGSTIASILVDSLSVISVSYSLSDTDPVPGTGNLHQDPLFTDANISNFELLPASPCINAGDPESPKDTDSTIADIGAYYVYQQPPEMPIVINEICYHALSSADPGDWIELHNNGSTDVDLSGWIFKDNDDLHRFVFPQGFSLSPGGFIVLVNDEIRFNEIFPDVYNYLAGMDFAFDNGGEELRLFDAGMNIADRVVFDDTLPWPLPPDGHGPTLELISPDFDNATAQSWQASKYNFGTPGEANSVNGIPETTILTDDAIQIFPNPSHGSLTISTGRFAVQPVAVSFYNLLGEEVWRTRTVSRVSRFDLHHLKKGMYIVVLRSENQVLGNRKIILN